MAVLLEDRLDRLAFLAKNNIFICGDTSRPNNFAWRADLVGFILESIKQGDTWEATVSDIAKKYSLPESTEASINQFVKELVNCGLLDQNKLVGVRSQKYIPNSQWKVTGGILLSSGTTEDNSGLKTHIFVSPRMDIVRVEALMRNEVTKYPHLLYGGDFRKVPYTLISITDGGLVTTAAKGRNAGELKAHWFKVNRVKQVPDFKDLDKDSWWTVFTTDYLVSRRACAAPGDSRVPDWTNVSPNFWSKFSNVANRLSYIKEICSWKAENIPVVDSNVVAAAPPLTPITATIGEKLLQAQAEAKAKLAAETVQTELDLGMADVVSVTETTTPKIAIAEKEVKVVKTAEEISAAKKEKKTMRELIKDVISADVSDAAKCGIISCLINAGQEEDPKATTLVSIIGKIVDVQVDDNTWNTMAKAVLQSV